MRTRRSIAIPSACCWFAVFNSLSTVSLQKGNYAEVYFLSKLTQGVSEVLSKRFSTSLCSRRRQHSTENITILSQTKMISNIHLESFVCVRILFLLIEHIFSGNGIINQIQCYIYLLVSINEKLVSLFICSQSFPTCERTLVSMKEGKHSNLRRKVLALIQVFKPQSVVPDKLRRESIHLFLFFFVLLDLQLT